MSNGSPSIVLRLNFPQEELAVLKTLAIGYKFDNINDYLHFALKRAVSEDVSMYNEHVRDYNQKLKEARDNEGLAVGGELGPDGLATEGTGITIAEAKETLHDEANT